MTGFDGRTNFKFIIPCISNCAVELFTGPNKDGTTTGDFYVNNLPIVETTADSRICYLEAPYNPSYFYKTNPQSHKARGGNVGNEVVDNVLNSGTIGGLGNVRPFSYSLIKDCILDFDRLYKKDDKSADER
nr:MAG TPA: hypothetical protein [Caudoviricetes sp.]DAH37543.1 MAG TPA: hypothetical protein [Caudoviricetes sp.]